MTRRRTPGRKAAKKGSPPVTGGTSRNNIDPEIVIRRRRAVNRLRADGYSLIEIAESLLQAHTSGDSPLFTFVDEHRQPVDLSTLTYAELRQRAADVVRKDVQEFRSELAMEAPSAIRIADDRYVLGERYRMLFKKAIEKMNNERDNARWNNLARTAGDFAARIGRLQGIETEKPMEIRLPERYRAWIDEDGIVHKDREDDTEGPAN